MPEKNNMELWESVETTPPSWTKKVTTRGGFTSITAHQQVKLATSMWGPYGQKWKMDTLEWGEIKDGAGNTVEITLSAIFVYPGGSFPIATDMQFRANGDSRKKLLTDATTKALSKLGFSADVFLGRFDDNKYVAEQRAKENRQPPTAPPPGPPPIDIPDEVRKLVARYGKNPCAAASNELWKEKRVPQTVDELAQFEDELEKAKQKAMKDTE